MPKSACSGLEPLLHCVSLLLAQSGHERLRIAALQTDPETHFAAHKFLLLMKERPHRTVPQNENREAARRPATDNNTALWLTRPPITLTSAMLCAPCCRV